MMEAISLLLFKEGFTIQPMPDGVSPQYYGIDEHMVWRSGISVPAAVVSARPVLLARMDALR